MAKNTKAVKNTKKTVCPLTKEEFLEAAKALNVTLDGQRLTAGVKEFSTGSFGWNLSGKVTIEVGEESVVCQVGLNIIVVGSKPEEE